MKLINLTLHNLTIHNGEGESTTIAPSGIVARVAAEKENTGCIDGIPVFKTSFGEIQDLPEAQEGVIYVASLLVVQAAKRADVFSPGELLRDEAGQPVGCLGLASHC
ncbi:hypothetical protein HW260_02090 [Helicobacter cinaedi]|uniref:Uncharacterized protein n=1 Tax=Helicobacter cinaedi CCUG 18818 = ATCC BAA-847 TaxID=537971 RepID=A0AAI8MPV5_9HELI|nr:hypothetical protein [Helicobacter cinaedi]EFR45492.1 hypothetical protein HCCG_00038 [Helicobacter cinaedi CCUG 18818 = ATCC BAA-847]QOQ91171.1 hypothetical protein HW260_02090 [Helicobacter cinaedi]BAM32872.1 hypothetical protein HCBAA847_1642 [Helicobacter cinaedi CCUG 18818 = ATCC BAA-847]